MMKKKFSDYGLWAIIVILLVAYGIATFGRYIGNKGSTGFERMSSNPNPAYNNSTKHHRKKSSGSTPQPSESIGSNEEFASVNGIQTSSHGMPSNASKQSIQNPAELLPLDSNREWAKLNPSGKGEIANINLLKAGYHIGIDTIGQTLRNSNLQIRSEPPNPQLYVGPWNLSTIEPDFMRPPLEVGQGTQ